MTLDGARLHDHSVELIELAGVGRLMSTKRRPERGAIPRFIAFSYAMHTSVIPDSLGFRR
jgi:hypothetical protein